MTSDRHAAENLNQLLEHRAMRRSRPIQMCDAASRNASKDFQAILANCMAHARRQFLELVDRFPDECAHVIEQLGKVYHTMPLSRDRASPRKSGWSIINNTAAQSWPNLSYGAKRSSMKRPSSQLRSG